VKHPPRLERDATPAHPSRRRVYRAFAADRDQPGALLVPVLAALRGPTNLGVPRPCSAAAATYPGRPEYVRQVRAEARGLLDGCPAADGVILCLSELAANAVLHSDSGRPGGTFTVRIESCPGASVRIEVADDGGPWLAPAPDPGIGRGLDIIRALAADWGVTPSPAGRTVWARFDWPSP
jgi:serine/threonine-protein kinase RsbW